MSFQNALRQRLASTLKRHSIVNAGRWACEYRYLKGKQWTWLDYPWLRQVHQSACEHIVIMKAAQMGFTEFAINTAFFQMDVNLQDVLYVLPTQSDASDFSVSRFDPALEGSPHLGAMFSDVKNVKMKRAGQSTLFVRGSKSRSQLKSIPTGVTIFDELDEMDLKNISLAEERASGQVIKVNRKISTPTFENRGIAVYFRDSTQHNYFFDCPRCSKKICLEFENLVITADDLTDPNISNSHLKCLSCGGKLNHEEKREFLAKGEYVAAYRDRPIEGYTINQLYSTRLSPVSIAMLYLRSLSDPNAEQELFNSKLAKTHIVDGAEVTDSELKNCLGSHRMGLPRNSGIRTMGVDVGPKWIHLTIDQWVFPKRYPRGLEINNVAKPVTLCMAKVGQFEELDKYMRDYGVTHCVIDKQPETRKAIEFACRFWGHVSLCMYGMSTRTRNFSESAEDEMTVTVDRTAWLDLALGRFHTDGGIVLPIDTPVEYKDHIKNPKRLYRVDKDGNQCGYYQSVGADHYAHARNYSEIALPLAAQHAQPRTIRKAV